MKDINFKKNVSKVLILIFLISFCFTGFSLQYVPPETVEQATIDACFYQGIKNNVDAYRNGTQVDAGWGNFNSYDLYVLHKAGVDLKNIVNDSGVNMEEAGIALIDATLADPNAIVKDWQGNDALKFNSKRVAQDYMLANELELDIKAGNLLKILNKRQKDIGNGSFANSAFTDLPTIDMITSIPEYTTGDTITLVPGTSNEFVSGDTIQFMTGATVQFVLDAQDSTSGAIPDFWPDVMASSQAVRVLKSLEKFSDTEGPAIESALAWLKTNQQDNGSVRKDTDDPFTDSGEVIKALKKVGIDPQTWNKDSNLLEYFFEQGKNEDGTFGTSKNVPNNTWAIEIAMDYYNGKLPAGVVRANYALGNIKAEFDTGIEVLKTAGYGVPHISPYNAYLISKSGVKIENWTRSGKNLKMIVNELNGASEDNAKVLASLYLAQKEFEGSNAQATLDLLTAKFNSETGYFAGSIYTDAAAFDYLAEAGVLENIANAKTVDYLIAQQGADGALGATFDGTRYIDFMATAQAIRVLDYLKTNLSLTTDKKAEIQTAIDDAMAWLKTLHHTDGSFYNDYDTPVVDTFELLLTLDKLDIDQATFKKDGITKTAKDYMLESAMDGSNNFGSGNITSNTDALHAYSLLGYTSLFADAPVVETPGGGDSGSEETIRVNVEVIGKSGETLYEGSGIDTSNAAHAGTALGALDVTGLSYTMEGTFVKSIAGQANEGMNGWMYKVNGEAPDYLASDYTLADGDNVRWFYSTDPSNMAGSDEVNGVVGDTEKEIEEFSEKTDETLTIDLDDKEPEFKVELETLEKFNDNENELVLDAGVVQLQFPVDSLISKEMKQEVLGDLGDKELKIEVKELENKGVIDKVAKEVFAIGDNLKLFDFNAEIIEKLSDGSESTKKLESFGKAIGVSISADELDLSKEELKELVAYRYSMKDGELIKEALESKYDEKKGIFTFYTDRFSYYGVEKKVEAKVENEIKLLIDSRASYLNGELRTIDTAPVIVDSRTMVPVRFIGETMGAQVEWIGETRKVEISLNGKYVEMYIGKRGVGLDVPPMIINSRTMVPIRFVSESLGASVEWNETDRSVVVKY